MKVYYINNHRSKEGEFLINLNTPEELAEYILSFLNDHGFRVYYFRLCELNSGEIMIDFGSHFQFYYIEDCEFNFRDLATRMEVYRKGFYGEDIVNE